MKLSQDQVKKFLQHFNEVWPEPQSCPICNNNMWAVGDDLYEVKKFGSREQIIGGKVIPLVVASCDRCGYTIFFNAVYSGIVESNA